MRLSQALRGLLIASAQSVAVSLQRVLKPLILAEQSSVTRVFTGCVLRMSRSGVFPKAAMLCPILLQAGVRVPARD